MTVTRANIETVIIRRVGAWLTAVGLDGTTVSGANLDLSDPIASALIQSGYSVADITNVSNSDLASVVAADYSKVLDIAELRTLETILQAYTTTDVEGLGYKKLGDQFGKRIEAAINRKRTLVQQRYGIDAATIQTGVIDLNFQQQNDTTIEYFV